MKLFSFIGGMLSDPNDKQGSTHRLCLILIILCVCGLAGCVGYAMCFSEFITDIPTEFKNLIEFVITTLVAGIGWKYGVAGVVAVKTNQNQTSQSETQING